MVNVVKYLRVSTPRQGDSGLGLAAQNLFVDNFLDSFFGPGNYRVVGFHIEVESGGTFGRIELMKAIKTCRIRDAILVTDHMDRLLRDGHYTMALLQQHNIQFIAAESPGDSDFIKSIKAAVATEARLGNSRKTKNSLQILKDRGVKLGRPDHLTDYSRDRARVAKRKKALENPNNIRAIAYIRELRKSGLSSEKIAIELNRNGFLSSTGKQFYKSTVAHLIKMFGQGEHAEVVKQAA